MTTDLRNNEFRLHFDTPDQFQDRMLTMLTGKYMLDVIKLDKWLHNCHRYNEEEHGSMADFIKCRFGVPASDFISSLI